MQKFDFIRNYISYRYSSRTKFDVHPPFLFDLITKVFEDKKNYPDYQKVEKLKKALIKNRQTVSITDLGAGSSMNKNPERSIGFIARTSSKDKKRGRLMYRLASYFKPGNILELGTSLGLSTAYLSLGSPESKIITIEGCPNIAALAEDNFKKLKLDNIDLICGNFDNELDRVLNTIPQLDFAFIDGNHKREPTIKYFEQCLSRTVNDSVLIFDDIHWSEGMETAWEHVKQHPAVTLSIDIFFMGIVFFRKELSREHFVIKY